MILGQILQLDVPAGKPSGPVGSIKLEHAPSPTILTSRHLHGLVFPDRRFGQFLSKQQYTAKRFFCRLQQFLYLLFAQGLRLHPMLF